MIFRLIILSLLFIVGLIPSYAFSETITGKVVSVADGDTVTILTPQKKQVKIRLAAVDCPESGQAFGKKAKKFTSSLVYGKPVQVEKETTDRYGRTVGFVYVDDLNLSEQIIRQGYGWVYRKYCKWAFCNDWLVLEEKARNARTGLWADPHAIPPWQWRAQKRNGSSSKSTVEGGPGIYHGNVKTKVLHAYGCQHYNCKNCTSIHHSLDSAIKSGYRMHKQCM